ncbi:alpha-D-glucose phosphate-specific phosphoglucomutase [Actinobacteria bacterium YIM 96077]|uniref:Phosphoglucomutase, alpha-D-glucose phosphate-specific n=1 Tax=Phytoactinopolyspora halophila TaxID=1981511 RepID=A0A329QGH6_9ACTN|nr:phosphoglucomutase (alpha-D-glucose-1,6-bisphosphate-dependent) [Phytoactinopolyspora halophila]AYY14461.1 alpha-D-glucose phosphate-specific phosphoglucomutase [Actinobacteria bacterium YIM 96077]RAW11454.1 phosphoglucomutase, alpha-D-glucose phosphate-specific [Phytoactinopolyspora halophila]
MPDHPRAGQPATAADLVDIAKLVTAYFTRHPEPQNPAQQVSFGTSGHRGSAFDTAFNETHIAATSQAICDYRSDNGIQGPLFLGKDTHALSEPAWATAVEVFAGNGVTLLIDSADRYTPTPAVSRAILAHNATGQHRADGVVVTPSHNPPQDGGFKYNPPDGGPAGSEITSWIQRTANGYVESGLKGVRRIPLGSALAADTTDTYDFLGHYVDDLPAVVDLDAIRAGGVRIGADPLGGASVDYWEAIAERHRLDLTVVNPLVDPTWRFMTLDWDGKIRMDCSSPSAMASLIGRMRRDAAQEADFDIATGNDADADRHGIVTADGGLMNPNHVLAVAIDYLFTHRDHWPVDAAIGKTLVSSSMINRVAASLGRPLVEVPVGFKWFVPGLLDATIGFGGEESAGASFLRRDGRVWSTDKDGISTCLLAAEIMGTTGKTPSEHYRKLTARHGEPAYARIDAPATREQKAVLAQLSPEQVSATELAGEPISAKLTRAPGNDAPIGGLKVLTESGWFAARPSGTEDVYKIYAESFRGREHLNRIQEEARAVVDEALAS